MVAHEPLVNKCFDHGIVPDVWKLEKLFIELKHLGISSKMYNALL